MTTTPPPERADRFLPVAPFWWITNFGGVVLTGVLAAWTDWLPLWVIFAGAVALHVGEAVYAFRAAHRAGFTRSAPRWALQTLGVGFPSLQALRLARAQ
jgi:hypothetical protein